MYFCNFRKLLKKIMNKISQNQHLFISKTNKISKIIFTTAAFHKERSDKRKDKTSTAFFGRQSPPLPKTHLRCCRRHPRHQQGKERESIYPNQPERVPEPSVATSGHRQPTGLNNGSSQLTQELQSSLSLSSSAMCPSPTRAISKLMQP